MGDEYFFHGGGGEAVACSIDDIIESRHDVELSIFVEVSRVSSGVVSWCFGHVFFEEGLVMVVKSAHEGRRHGQSDADLA